MTKIKKITIWVTKIIISVFLVNTLISFKFPGHPDSVAIFTELGLLGLPEQFGRIGTGVAELIAVILLLIPKTQKLGSLGVIVLMLGALGSHITKLGFEGDHLSLGIMSIVLLICGGYIFKNSLNTKTKS